MFYIVTNEGILDNLIAFIKNDYSGLAKKLYKHLNENELDEEKLEKMNIKILDSQDISDRMKTNDIFKEINKTLSYFTRAHHKTEMYEVEKVVTDLIEVITTSVNNLDYLYKKVKQPDENLNSSNLSDCVKIIELVENNAKHFGDSIRRTGFLTILERIRSEKMTRGLLAVPEYKHAFGEVIKYIKYIVDKYPKVANEIISLNIRSLKKATKAITK